MVTCACLMLCAVGFCQNPSKVVDIFNISAGTWSNATLSQPRGCGLAATSLPDAGVAIFAGGYYRTSCDVCMSHALCSGQWRLLQCCGYRGNLSRRICSCCQRFSAMRPLPAWDFQPLGRKFNVLLLFSWKLQSLLRPIILLPMFSWRLRWLLRPISVQPLSPWLSQPFTQQHIFVSLHRL